VLLLLSSLLLSLSTRQAENVSGYLIDQQCVDLCVNKTADEPCTADNVNVFYEPQEGHTGGCLLLVPSCVDSGYVLMSKSPRTDDGSGTSWKHSVVLDLRNNVSFPTVLEYITAGTRGMFPLVSVEYNATAAQKIDTMSHMPLV
jgi:hypothetical protein